MELVHIAYLVADMPSNSIELFSADTIPLFGHIAL